MSIESNIQTLLEADGPIMALLTGGIYIKEEIGDTGITRTSAPGAFDADEWLLPSVFISERSRLPNFAIIDYEEKLMAQTVVVELFVYQRDGYDIIDSAIDLIFDLLFGTRLTGTLPMDWINLINRMTDEGPLAGASMARQDWVVPLVKGA